MINPFASGGTNWLVLKFEKAGVGLFTGLYYQMGMKGEFGRIDVSTKEGMAKLENRLYLQSRVKDNYMRGLVGGVVNLVALLTYLSLGDDDDKFQDKYRKWSKENPWAAKYLNTLIPEYILLDNSIKDKTTKRYVATLINKNDAFDASTKFMKSLDYAMKGKKDLAYGALGEGFGSKLNVPLPWRLVKDGKVVYQGIKGEDPYHANYKPSEGFISGVLQGGIIEWLGYRPLPPKKEEREERPKEDTREERSADDTREER